MLPWADVQHVGSTAVPGSLTKGDLDIQVRVPADRFAEAEACLAGRYDRNTGSLSNASFASFKNDDLPIPLGIQLSAIDGPQDIFVRWRDLMLADPTLVDAYNALKRRFHGGDMGAYRAAKTAFIESVLGRSKKESD